MDNKSIRILVVDDEPEIRSMISDYLRDEENYTVFEVHDGYAALEFLATQPIDLVLSDINMPGMKGFDLLREVREKYPETRRILITAYNVEEYLDLALKHDIGNIFVKTTPFNFHELTAMLKNLLSHDIFGLEKYFSPGFQCIHHTISRAHRLDLEARSIVGDIDDPDRARKIELVLVELLTNAIFYGVKDENPERKELWPHSFELPADRAIDVNVAWDDVKYAISVRDSGGKLKKADVLYWLHRQIARDDKGLPLGLYDSHGRGFFIARRYIDRLIVNIDHTRQTEIIIINYYSNTFQGFKPLFINEL